MLGYQVPRAPTYNTPFPDVGDNVAVIPEDQMKALADGMRVGQHYIDVIVRARL
jgi:hypothetical protein